MKQLGFGFLSEDNYNINNFIVFDSNIEAYYFLNKNKEDENILDNQLIFLSGEEKCGKTHLGYIWKQKHNAKTLNYNNLFSLNMDNFIQQINNIIEKFDYYLLDDLPNDFCEEKLFYLLNMILNNSSAILIISCQNILKRKIQLKDLKSRINSGINLKIKKISKNIKTMFIVKLFSDKQICTNGEILKYLTKKLDNNYKSIFDSIEFINENLIDAKTKLTLKFVKELIK